MFERFWKSGVPRVEKNLAEPPVGSTWFGTREVIAEGLGSVRPEENAAGVADQGQKLQRLADEQFEVLGRDRVGHLHPLLQVADDHDQALPAQGGARDVGTGQRVDLALDLDAGAIGEFLRIGDQDAGRQLVVLGLGEQVGRDVPRVGRGVGEDEDLAGTGDHVDVDFAENHASSRSPRRCCPARRSCPPAGSSPCRRPAPRPPGRRRCGRSPRGRACRRRRERAG